MAENTDTEQVINAKVDTSNAEKSTKSLKTQIREVREELQTLKRGTDEYNQALERYGALMKENTRVMKDMKASATDAIGTFSNMAGAVKGLTGGFQTFLGTMGLAKGDTQELTETFMKLQSAMAITQGLKAMQSGIKNLNVVWSAFNKTLLANPFTAIATVLLALISYFADWDEVISAITKPFKDLWNSIKELLPDMEGMGGVTDYISASISALFSYVSNLITGPFQTLIDVVKKITDVFKGNISVTELLNDIFETVGDTLENIFIKPIKSIIDLFTGEGSLNDVFDSYLNSLKSFLSIIPGVGNSFKALDKAAETFNDSLNKEEEQIKVTSKSIKALIEDKEAMYGADFKNSEEGRKLWKEYYDTLISETKEGTEEWRKATNQKIVYERQLTEDLRKEEEKRREEAMKTTESQISYWKSYQMQWLGITDQYSKEGQAFMKNYFARMEILYENDENRLAKLQEEMDRYWQTVELKNHLATENRKKEQATADAMMLKEAEAFWKSYEDFVERYNTAEIESSEKSTTEILSDLTNRTSLIKDQMQKQFEIINDETKSWEERSIAVEENKKLLEDLLKAEKEQKEIEKGIVEDRALAIAQVEKATENHNYLQLLQSDTELQKEDTKAYKASLQERMQASQEHITELNKQLSELNTSDENYLSERQKLLDERNTEMASFTDSYTKYLEEASAKEQMAFFDGLASMYQEESEKVLEQMEELKIAWDAYAVETAQMEEEMRIAQELGLDDVVEQYQYELDQRYIKDAEYANEYNKLQEEQNEADSNRLASEKKTEESYEQLQKDRQEATEATLNVASDCFGTMADMFGEQTVAGKVAAVAQTTIDTYSSAVKSFNAMADVPFVGPALGAIAAAEAVASGVMNIKEILAVDTGSDKDTTTSASVNAALPDMPEVDDITESYTTVTGFDEDVINDLSQPVLVVEDVNDAQNRVSTAESNSTF